jgi:hypothetical protein
MSICSSNATVIWCNSAEKLFPIVNLAKENDTIIVRKNLLINLNGKCLKLKAGITLKGEVDSKNKWRPILTKTKNDGLPLIECLGENIEIENLILSGPDSIVDEELYMALSKNNKKEYYKIKPSKGILSNFGKTKVSSCELKYFSHAAIAFYNYSNFANVPNVVKNCYIHHNYRPGLGYGIANDNSSSIIINNYFNSNRHAVQGTGKPFTSYIAFGNLIGPTQFGHAFDMHGGFDRKDNSDIAGNLIFIFGNITLNQKFPFVKIRGVPSGFCLVSDNLLFYLRKDMEILQLHSKGNMISMNNHYFN